MIIKTYALRFAFSFFIPLGLLTTAQDYKLDLGDIYLPMLAESYECGSEQLADFGFSDREVELLTSFVIQSTEANNVQKNCYLFKGVTETEARQIVATLMRDFADKSYWHGIPKDFGGLHLVQGKMDKSLVAFSFLSEESKLGPDSGIAGFDLDNKEGLVMHLWSVFIYKH